MHACFYMDNQLFWSSLSSHIFSWTNAWLRRSCTTHTAYTDSNELGRTNLAAIKQLMLHQMMDQLHYLSMLLWMRWWPWPRSLILHPHSFFVKGETPFFTPFCCCCWTLCLCIFSDTELLHLAQRHAASCVFFCSCHQPQPFISVPQDLCPGTNSQYNYKYEKSRKNWSKRTACNCRKYDNEAYLQLKAEGSAGV